MLLKKRLRLVIGCLAALAIVAAAVPSLANNTSSTEATSGYSGETLFRGVFFGQGPVATEVADLFPGLVEAVEALPDAERDRLAELRSRTIGHIRTAHPGFFRTFAQQMQSGDHLVIDSALTRGGKYLFEAYEVEFGPDFVEALARGESVGRGKGLHLVGVGLVGVIVGVVVVIAVTAETILAVHFIADLFSITRCAKCTEVGMKQIRLLREILIDRIATSLNATA